MKLGTAYDAVDQAAIFLRHSCLSLIEAEDDGAGGSSQPSRFLRHSCLSLIEASFIMLLPVLITHFSGIHA